MKKVLPVPSKNKVSTYNKSMVYSFFGCTGVSYETVNYKASYHPGMLSGQTGRAEAGIPKSTQGSISASDISRPVYEAIQDVPTPHRYAVPAPQAGSCNIEVKNFGKQRQITPANWKFVQCMPVAVDAKKKIPLAESSHAKKHKAAVRALLDGHDNTNAILTQNIEDGKASKQLAETKDFINRDVSPAQVHKSDIDPKEYYSYFTNYMLQCDSHKAGPAGGNNQKGYTAHRPFPVPIPGETAEERAKRVITA